MNIARSPEYSPSANAVLCITWQLVELSTLITAVVPIVEPLPISSVSVPSSIPMRKSAALPSKTSIESSASPSPITSFGVAPLITTSPSGCKLMCPAAPLPSVVSIVNSPFAPVAMVQKSALLAELNILMSGPPLSIFMNTPWLKSAPVAVRSKARVVVFPGPLPVAVTSRPFTSVTPAAEAC